MRNKVFVSRLKSDYIGNDCVQVMLPYNNFHQLYGNNKIMFNDYRLNSVSICEEENTHLSINKTGKYKNVYVEDDKRKSFPHNDIPEHSERNGLFRRINYVNQILNFEKPYIKINDGMMSQITAYKDGDSAIVQTKLIDDKNAFNYKICNREEIVKYLQTGSLTEIDENNYEKTYFFDKNGGIYDINLKHDLDIINQKIDILSKGNISLIDSLNFWPIFFHDFGVNLEHNNFDSFVLFNKRIIKFTKEGKINIDRFHIIFLDINKYLIIIDSMPIVIDSLREIKNETNNIIDATEPNINKKFEDTYFTDKEIIELNKEPAFNVYKKVLCYTNDGGIREILTN